jgi:hypothetical protein
MSNGTANGYFPDLQHADIHQPRARKPINAAVARAFAQDAAVHDVSALARYEPRTSPAVSSTTIANTTQWTQYTRSTRGCAALCQNHLPRTQRASPAKQTAHLPNHRIRVARVVL